MVGHVAAKCRKDEDYVICTKCQGDHKADTCTATADKYKCIICPDELDRKHDTKDSKCPTMIREKEICNVMATQGMTYFEAREMVKKPAKSYSSMLKRGTMVSVGTQTECNHGCDCVKSMPVKPTEKEMKARNANIKTTNTSTDTKDNETSYEMETENEIRHILDLPKPVSPLQSQVDRDLGPPFRECNEYTGETRIQAQRALRGYMKDWKERKKEKIKARLGEQYISETDTESDTEGDEEY